MTRSRLVKLVLAVSAIAILGLGVAAGVAASRNSDSNDTNDVVLQGDQPGGNAWLGIQAQTSHDPDGVAIIAVADDSPAAGAGLEPDDVILSVDGDETMTPGALKKAIRDRSPGDEVTLSVIKGGSGDPTDVTVVLGEHPALGELFDGLGDRIDELTAGLHDSLNEAFDRFLDVNLRFLDDDGNVVELAAVGGTVAAVNDSEITIDTADGGQQTFALTDDTHVPDGLAEGDRVVVISVDGEVTAVTGLGPEVFKHLPLPQFHLPFGNGDLPFDFDLGESRFCRDGEGLPWSKDDHPNLERLRDKLCDAEPESTPAP